MSTDTESVYARAEADWNMTGDDTERAYLAGVMDALKWIETPKAYISDEMAALIERTEATLAETEEPS